MKPKNTQQSETRNTIAGQIGENNIYFDGINYFVKVNNMILVVDEKQLNIKDVNGGNISNDSFKKQYRGRVNRKVDSKTKIPKQKRNIDKKISEKRVF